jgi:hypothetical protein
LQTNLGSELPATAITLHRSGGFTARNGNLPAASSTILPVNKSGLADKTMRYRKKEYYPSLSFHGEAIISLSRSFLAFLQSRRDGSKIDASMFTVLGMNF